MQARALRTGSVDDVRFSAVGFHEAAGSAGFDRVLVGFDRSESAGDALALAQRLLEPQDGRLLVAHVEVDRHWPRRRPEQSGAEALARCRAQLAPGTDATELLRASASVPRGLTELAEEEHVDLVVVGSSGSAPAGRTAPGRTALRLMQGAPCAVAIAAAGRRDEGSFHHVGIAYDGSPESKAALAKAYALARRDGAAVSLYMAIPAGAPAPQAGVSAREFERAALAPRLEAQELLDSAADAAPVSVNPRTVLLHGDPAREIPGAADGIIDILFAGSRGYGPMHRALAGSVSEALLRLSTQPVVVMPRRGVPE
jgi:nucleotide-binding universal stress UspA family protein